jgi:periplasmic protein TonB
MSLEATRVPENGFGSLQSCLVEGDPQSEKRARRIKQRAVAISIALQTLALTALILFPLLSKGERIPIKIFDTLPPYHRGTPHPVNPGPRPNHPDTAHHFYPPTQIPKFIPTGEVRNIIDTTSENISDLSDPPLGDASGNQFGNDTLNPKRGPEKPPEIIQPTVRHTISELQQMAQLKTRVEPVYPRLAVQIQREGRVELHALISPEGTIESLEVLSGDPLFIQSALAAVHHWRYRPTILNGRPIEVDTHITVIYTLSH